jgi:NADPH:quinone reductase-like Zn-dependent oxidoreductase
MDVGMKCTEDIVLSTLLESHFVGVVRECPDDAEEMYGITRGSRVASIYPWGANAKFVSVPVDSLVAVPKDLEAADLSCLFSFYLPAFQILHHGRGRPYRYSRPCLKGRRLLITGGASLMAQAVIRLAKLAKAGEIFVTAPREHHLILTRLGVAALDEKPDSWLPVVDHSMDIVLDFEFPKHFSSIQQALSPRGRLVCSPQSRSDADGFSCIPSRLVNIFELFKLSGVKRATFFDFAVENAEQNRDGLWEDMKFLVKHLFSRQIRPQIDRIITLKDIPQVFREMQKREEPLSGAIICEPWKPY